MEALLGADRRHATLRTVPNCRYRSRGHQVHSRTPVLLTFWLGCPLLADREVAGAGQNAAELDATIHMKLALGRRSEPTPT